MPPKNAQPKVYHLLFKTHQQTVFLSVVPSTSIKSLKSEILDALSSFTFEPPCPRKVTSEDEFEICRLARNTARANAGIVDYDELETAKDVKSSGITNWETLFLRFNDEDGNPLPVEYTPASIEYDDAEEAPEPIDEDELVSAKSRGKRKAPPED